jgi:two-component system nitrogen regulation sensor histidine kinase NtrY
MILKKYYIQIIIRILVLALTALAFTWSWTNLNNLFTFLITGFLFFVQVLLLIHYFNKINRDLNTFLQAVKSRDSMVSFSPVKFEKKFSKLNRLFDEINKNLQNVKIEKENQYFYLKYIIEHVDVGLIAFENSGRIDLANRAVKKLLKLPDLKQIEKLNSIHPEFENRLRKLDSGQQNLMVIPVRDDTLHLLIRVTEFKLLEKKIKLASFQNIRTELDEKELESWQKLIRVLTHEIMNSVSPITSLATTLSRIFKYNGQIRTLNELKENNIKDTVTGLEIIRKRTKGLLEFIKQYRKVNLLPKPDMSLIRISELLNDMKQLFGDEFDNQRINVPVQIIPESLSLRADKKLIEQILINLINNSLWALKGRQNGQILLKGFINTDNRKIIQVIDNGIGIPENIKNHIFTPFFTTREKGSGIGLGLSKQIMHLHKGNILFKSIPDQETTFSLVF